MSQVTRQRGNGDKGVHSQPVGGNPKEKERVAQLILISHQARLILHARHTFVKKTQTHTTIYLCPPPADATQQCTASRLSVWHDLTVGLITALELLTEADRSHFKVIAALLLLMLAKWWLFHCWWILATESSAVSLLLCCMPAKSALKQFVCTVRSREAACSVEFRQALNWYHTLPLLFELRSL